MFSDLLNLIPVDRGTLGTAYTIGTSVVTGGVLILAAIAPHTKTQKDDKVLRGLRKAETWIGKILLPGRKL